MVRRLRPTRIEYVVDGHRLRAQLSAAALDALGDEAEQRRRALEVLRAALFRGRMIAKERLEDGASGIETAQILARVVDEVITALYDFTTVHVFRARNPTEGERPRPPGLAFLPRLDRSPGHCNRSALGCAGLLHE